MIKCTFENGNIASPGLRADQIAFDHGEDLVMYRNHLLLPQPLPIIG